MKGAVKKNTSPPTGRSDERVSWQPARSPLRRAVDPALEVFDTSSQRGVVFRKLKSVTAA